jgi:hypothetical protein
MPYLLLLLQVMGEAVLSPAIPSVAARAGGIFFPLAKVRSRHDMLNTRGI